MVNQWMLWCPESISAPINALIWTTWLETCWLIHSVLSDYQPLPLTFISWPAIVFHLHGVLSTHIIMLHWLWEVMGQNMLTALMLMWSHCKTVSRFISSLLYLPMLYQFVFLLSFSIIPLQTAVVITIYKQWKVRI